MVSLQHPNFRCTQSDRLRSAFWVTLLGSPQRVYNNPQLLPLTLLRIFN
ncbi:MAG: hypothetical protein V7K38_10470 [Nostoc sp.]